MTDTPNASIPSTTETVAGTAATDEGTTSPVSDPAVTAPPVPTKGDLFLVGEGVARAVEGRPYERRSGMPLYRPLKIFALDPSVSRLEGATALVNVPYEPLKPGPEGKLFKVSNVFEDGQVGYPPLNLEDKNILIQNGLNPSTSDARFQDQMVYAVCSIVYTAFRTALGRHITWGFKKEAENNNNAENNKKDKKKKKDKRSQLVIKPRAFEANNSHYDKQKGELCFGYYRSAAQGKFPGTVYACLSHDTVAHEVTHALLDGLRAHFSLPTSADVLAFHEGFADLVAVFQHFSYEQVVRTAIRNSRGKIGRAALLTDIARQLGQTGRDYKTALRSAIDFVEESGEQVDGGGKKSPRLYDPKMGSHDLGSVLVIAVFEAFIAVFKRKTERLMRLASNGSGRLPPGDLPADLQAALAEKASKLANQFLTICIRAIDYCPPVDITFGEYLRAVITADKDLVPDDPWAYREAWIDAFGRHHIYPSGVADLSEDALLWDSPGKQKTPLPRIKELRFGNLRFSGDPAWPASSAELNSQAMVLGNIVTRPEWMSVFGLAKKGDKLLEGDVVHLPKIQSIRSSRRVGPSGQIVFDIVAEVTQKREATFKKTNEKCTFYGGSTVIIDPDGRIRYVIMKSITNGTRLNQQEKFLASHLGKEHKPSLCENKELNVFAMLHEEDPAKPGPGFPFFW